MNEPKHADTKRLSIDDIRNVRDQLQSNGLITRAAVTAHEVNRVYCVGLGDYSQLSWDNAPQWQRDSAIAGAKAIACNPNMTAEQIHEGWLEQKRVDGWKFGPVKDVDLKEHPCFVPYSDLPANQRHKDTLFGATVRGVLGLPPLNSCPTPDPETKPETD